MQSSNFQLTPIEPKRGWKTGAAVIGLLSVGAGVGVNFILNPPTTSADASGSTGPQTVTGDTISYRYGEIQLEITTTNGKIETITEKVATASPGYDTAFPYLHDDAIAAHGTGFANLSGATFSSEAYREALASAISKLQ